MRRQTGDLVGTFFEARPGLSLEVKYELVKFYLSVAVLRMHVGEQRDAIEKVRHLSAWEAGTHEALSFHPGVSSC